MVKDIGRLLAEEAEAAEEHRDDDVPLVRSRRPAKEPAQGRYLATFTHQHVHSGRVEHLE